MKETKAWLLRKSSCFFACSKRAGVLLSVSMSLNESVIYFKFRERMAEKRENLNKLQNAFASLTDEEKELVWFLYLCKEPLTETQVASVLHISQQAVNKRKKNIGKNEKLLVVKRISLLRSC